MPFTLEIFIFVNVGLVETINLAAGAVPSTRTINGHALNKDTNVTAQDIFNAQTIGIDAGQNLNDFKTAGLYFQGMNVNTSSALNYPENNAGALIVLRSAGITQIYYVYNSSRIWSRSQYSTGAWTPWAREYNTQNKPGAVEIGALPITGGTLNGSLGIGTANGLGGNSIVIGDSDTGFKQNGDGILDVYANSAHVFRFINSTLESMKSLKVTGNSVATGEVQSGNGSARLATDGNIYGTIWGGWLSGYLQNNVGVQDTRYGSELFYNPGGNGLSWIFRAPSGHTLSGINVQETGSNSADNIGGVYYRPLQKKISGTWYNVASI
jgi:hypothetical protein